MPQLNPLDWGPQLIWLLITFGVLYLLMVNVALPRIGSVIEARADRIAKDLAEADRLRRQTEEAIAAYEQALAEAKQKAHAIVEEGRAKLKAETRRRARPSRCRPRQAWRRGRDAHRSGQGFRHARRERCRRRRGGGHRAPADRHRAAPRPRSIRRSRPRGKSNAMEFLLEPEFWVAISFFLFVGLLLYFGVHKKLATVLDARAASIAKELDEAKRLRDEAEKVLADYRRKQGDARRKPRRSSTSPPRRPRSSRPRRAAR